MTMHAPVKTQKVEWRVKERLIISENHNGTIDIDDHFNLTLERAQAVIDTLTAYLQDVGARNKN